MKFVLAILLLISTLFVTKANIILTPSSSDDFSQNDSVTEMRDFKIYLKVFVRAVVTNDTSFIKAHTIFPVANSTVSSRKIDQRYFMKHFSDFFPKDLLKRVEKEGKIVVSTPDKIEKDFIVTIYDTTQGTDANYSWVFTKKGRDFFFVTFRAEVG